MTSPLSLVPATGAPDKAWVSVLRGLTGNTGADPFIVWTESLALAGSVTIGPDEKGEHTSSCPAPGHEDAKPSLRWRQSTDGQILFDCRAGCEGQDILDTLGLTFVQLKWLRTQYEFRTEDRELIGFHCRESKPDGGKRFFWEHKENGGMANGRPEHFAPALWALPDLYEVAAAALDQGKKIHLYLAEGEKDCLNIAEAFEAGWVASEEAGPEWVHLVSTAPDGADSWNRTLTEQVLTMRCAHVTIVCDSDQAGTRRGTTITEALRLADTGLVVHSINWLGQSGIRDASLALQEYTRYWLQRATATADADIYLWSSHETGWLYETDSVDAEGHPAGKRTLARTVNAGRPNARMEAVSRWPLRVDAVTVDVSGVPVGWEVDLGSGGRALIKTTDLDGSSLERWNSRVGAFIVPTRGLTAALRAYLGFHGTNAHVTTVYDHEGWVDGERFVTRAGLLIGPEGESGCALGGTENSGTEWHYGMGDEREAAALMIKLLTFRDLSESGPVLAWLTAQAVRPRSLAASGASFVPMLQVPGASGIGKTSFLRLATRLFGFSGNPISNVTNAGLVRTLALTTGVVWIDDFTDYDDTIRDIIRGGITGAGRTRGTSASERGVVRDEAYASLINSGENAFDANERAMSQRSVILEFARGVQGRRNGDGTDQYPELEQLGVAREDKGAGLSRWAGTVIRGLWQAAGEIDARGEGLGTNSGVRGQAAWDFVRYGALVMVQWLRNCECAEERVAKLEATVPAICNQQATNAARRERSGVDTYLVQEIVPRYLHWARQRMDSAISAWVDEFDLAEIKVSIRRSWIKAHGKGPHGAEQTPRPIVVISRRTWIGEERPEPTEDDDAVHEKPLAIAVNTESLYQWASGSDGQRAGVTSDDRHISVMGIAMQLKQVTDKTMRDPSVEGSTAGFRVRLSRTQNPRYRLITEPDVIAWLCG